MEILHFLCLKSYSYVTNQKITEYCLFVILLNIDVMNFNFPFYFTVLIYYSNMPTIKTIKF